MTVRLVVLNQSGFEGTINAEQLISVNGVPFIDPDDQCSQEEMFAALFGELAKVNQHLDKILGEEPL